MKKWIVWYIVIVLVAIGLSVYHHADNWEKTAVVLPGKVVDSVSRRGSKGQTTYSEVISFEFQGATYRFTRSSSSSGHPHIGRSREVIANPTNPHQARVKLAPVWEFLFPSMVKNKPALGFLWLMGSVFLAFGWFWCLGNYEFFRRAIIVPGRVTSFTSRRGSKGGTVYYEEVTFDFAGEQHTVSGRIGKGWKPKIGTERKVGIDPNQMDNCLVKESMWMPGLFLIIGLVLLGVSVWV